VTRVVSGAVLLSLAVALVWLASDAIFFVVAELLLVLALVEYAGLARASGLVLPLAPAGAAAMLTAAAFTRMLPAALDVVLMSALVALGAVSLTLWRGGRDALAVAASSLFPALYLGLPVGAMIAIRESRGRAALFLLILTVSASDTAQYYSGRAFGRQPLAPAISPKKTVEGAAGGLLFGAIALAVIGIWWLPAVPAWVRATLGIGVVVLGIAGDLFESMLKRSAGVKDSSALIPGHGGILDRIDALLFAAPMYYVVLRWVGVGG
jgi:phosphatidate cytidylyltransferase